MGQTYEGWLADIGYWLMKEGKGQSKYLTPDEVKACGLKEKFEAQVGSKDAAAVVFQYRRPPAIEVGSTVIFTGPEYGHGATTPTIGERGVVIAMEGYTSQRVGEQPVEMITVKFPLDKKAQVIGIDRVKLEPPKK